MIVLTYRRLGTLPRFLATYCNLNMLDKLLVIWNDIENPMPQYILDIGKQCTVNITFIVSEENKMSNRFRPRSVIETDCELAQVYSCVLFFSHTLGVFIMDDDLIISASDMQFGIKSWQVFFVPNQLHTSTCNLISRNSGSF